MSGIILIHRAVPRGVSRSRNTESVNPAEQTDAAVAAMVAAEAGELLLAVREEVGFYDSYDLGDAGDRRANVLILKRLAELRPGDAVLSEEAADDRSRVHADRVWIVDPVDGTREFSMAGHADWAVHIALWQRDGTPEGSITDAAVALPAVGEVYRTDTVQAPPPRRDGPIRITASSYRPPAVLWWLREHLDMRWSGSARRAPRRWRWCAATSTPTSMPAGSGSGIRRHPPAWCRPPACTPHGWVGRR